MAKRFTDSDKFRDPFYRSLPSPYKLLWDFIHHECDHSGIWMVDMEVAQICIGKDLKINTQTALEYFTQDDRRLINAIDVYQADAASMVKLFPHRYVSISGTDAGHDVVAINEDFFKVAYRSEEHTSELQSH